jgi:hypothetical protein
MAAPTPAVTALRVPAGRFLELGKQILVTIKGDGTSYNTIGLWEQTVTPMSLSGGDKVNIGNQYNTKYETFVPQRLITVGPMQMTVQYDPAAIDDITQAINDNTTITIHFPNGDRLAYYGYLKEFTPGEVARNGNPTATVVIEATMWDPVNFVESDFAISEAA